ncbi:co-chaperone GroES [bacterium]|jgi:chaperonin GroES|nr:co-chaperone GroES [bacterium]MBT4250879.1 co-chaperone GroES [bacterium]MBT4597592.1 co-chaperone GroES [bacterium]MBT6754057.1 co-chaperone GroES [bacterium]MBT7038087.1 co-chaperone GroES [bacterium]
MKKIKPIGSNVVVQIPKAEEMTKGGIFIPQTASKEKSQIGIVVAVGESEKINKQIKKETSVLYEKYSGTEIEVDGEKFVILDAAKNMILAIVQ